MGEKPEEPEKQWNLTSLGQTIVHGLLRVVLQDSRDYSTSRQGVGLAKVLAP